MNRENLNPDTMAKSHLYTQIVKPARNSQLIFISGQTAIDREGQIVGKDDFEKQAIQVFENIRAALNSVGATFSNLVKITTYLTAIQNREMLGKVRSRYFDQNNLPTSTLVEVKSLAHQDYLIEIEAVAAVA